jgi:hypothetical protein
MAENFDVTVFQGETLTIPWTVTKNGGAEDVSGLSDASIAYRIGRTGDEAMIEKDLSGGIAKVGGGSTGQITISVANADTSTLAKGLYDHELVIRPTAGEQHVLFSGSFRVRNSIHVAG